MSQITEIISAQSLLEWIIIACLIGYFIYREYPEFKRRISSGAEKEEKAKTTGKSINERLDKIEGRLDSIDEKLKNDYASLTILENEEKKDRRLFKDSLEEREIIMRALLGVINGLQEIGANGGTKAAQQEIMDYLAKQAHKTEEE